MELKHILQVLDASSQGWKSVSWFVSSVVLLRVALEQVARYLGMSDIDGA